MIFPRFASCRGVIHYAHRSDGTMAPGQSPKGAIYRAPTRFTWLLPITGIILLLAAGGQWQPWQRLLGATLGLLYLLKGAVVIRFLRVQEQRLSVSGALLFFTLWPGMDPFPFEKRQRITTQRPRSFWRFRDPTFLLPLLRGGWEGCGNQFIRGLRWLMAGFCLSITITMIAPFLPVWALGWLGITALLMTIHLGYANILTAVLRLCGWKVGLLFDEPFRSKSLTDFWSHRWNLAFVEMDRILFLKPLIRWFGRTGAILGVFAISGLLHEMAVSYPVQAGWGGPLLYFTLQGLLVLFESKALYFQQWPSVFRRIWTWLWIITPLPLLFHVPFRNGLIVPLYQNLNKLFLP